VNVQYWGILGIVLVLLVGLLLLIPVRTNADAASAPARTR
jgi:UMF1 family MFS transporter